MSCTMSRVCASISTWPRGLSKSWPFIAASSASPPAPFVVSSALKITRMPSQPPTAMKLGRNLAAAWKSATNFLFIALGWAAE